MKPLRLNRRQARWFHAAGYLLAHHSGGAQGTVAKGPIRTVTALLLPSQTDSSISTTVMLEETSTNGPEPTQASNPGLPLP